MISIDNEQVVGWGAAVRQACRGGYFLDEPQAGGHEMDHGGGGCWEHFSHGADVGVRGVGPGPAVAFEQAALALAAVVTPPEKVASLQTIVIHCEAPDLDLLLVDWLNALIFEMATRRMLFHSFEVVLTGTALRAVARGELLDRPRHCPAVEIKAATYSELTVTRQMDGTWVAQTVVDV